MESVLVTKIMSGTSGEERLMALVAILNDAPRNESQKKGMHEAHVEAVDFIRAACEALSVLYDPDPAAISDCAVEMKAVRDIVMGSNVRPPWTLLSEAFDESPAWAERKKDFRRSVMSDLTVGRACERLPSWVARCRDGGTAAFQECLFQAIGRFMEDLERTPGGDEKLNTVKALEGLLANLNSGGARDPPGTKAQVSGLRKQLRAMREEREGLSGSRSTRCAGGLRQQGIWYL